MMPEQVQQIVAENERLKKEVVELKALVHELRAILNRDSTNSHKPPSQDPPKSQAERNKRKRQRKKAKKRGGQPGHKGHHRQLLPVEEVDEVFERFAHECKGCGAELSGTDPKPHRHQVTELPPIKPHVTEYRLHRRKCLHCKAVTKGSLPEGVDAGAFGPRLKACVAMLTGRFFLSKDESVELLGNMMGTTLSTGSVCNIERQMGQALQKPMDEAQDFIKASAVIHMDETSWRTDKFRSWLWTASSGPIAMYAVCDERAGLVAKELIGEDFAGLVNTDRYSAYGWLPAEQRQFCWAHLLRDFRAMSARSGATGEVGAALVAQTNELFSVWHRIRDGTLKHSGLKDAIEPVKAEIERLLERGGLVGSEPFGGMCRNILRNSISLWRFLEIEGVEPTNNEAERNLRRGVLWRKRCFGNDSVQGTIFTERILTVVESLRRQGRHVLSYLTEAIDALVRGDQPPSLLPAPT